MQSSNRLKGAKMRLTTDEILEAQHQFWMGRDTKKHIKKQIREFETFLRGDKRWKKKN